jgi:hypothetical protein
MTILLTARLREAARWKTFEPGDMVEAAERIERLEAALRAVRDFEPVTNGDYAVMDAIPALRKIAITALGSSAETEPKPTYYFPIDSRSSICKHCHSHVREHEFGGRCLTEKTEGKS